MPVLGRSRSIMELTLRRSGLLLESALDGFKPKPLQSAHAEVQNSPAVILCFSYKDKTDFTVASL